MATRKGGTDGDTSYGTNWRQFMELAHRYLGSGTRYQEIVNEHNKEAARFGQHSRLLRIEDPNLIFVGQTIMCP
jgi:nucleoid-associated protein YgaU